MRHVFGGDRKTGIFQSARAQLCVRDASLLPKENPPSGMKVFKPADGEMGDGDAQLEASPGKFTWLDVPSIQAAFQHCLSLPKSVLISSFFINLLGLALPLVILQIYDRILPHKATDTLAFLGIGLAGIVVIEAAMKIARSHVMSWAALQAGYAAEVSAVNRLLRADKSDIAKDGTALWIDRLDALEELNFFYGGPARLVLVDLPFVAIFFVVITLVGGPLVLVPLVVIACFAGHTVYSGRRLLALLEARSGQDARRYDFIVECLRGIGFVKSAAMEPAMLRRFERLQRSSAEVSYKMISRSNEAQSFGNLFANVSMVSMVTIGALAVMSGQLSIGALACCSLLAGRVVQPVLRSISVWTELQNVTNCYKRAAPLFSLPEASFLDQGAVDIKGAITIRELAGRKSDGAVLFDKISLSVDAGQFIGLRGRDDSGRTHLIKAILGEEKPVEGSVYIDGLNVFSPSIKDARRAICYVGSSAPVFKGSVIDNITMFRSGEAMRLAREASQLIGLEDDIQFLPEGYDTFIGEGVADSVSRGLRQRIAIARALAARPKILIFDKANSAIDFTSDRKLREGLVYLKGTMTFIIVSDRPSFLAISDAVYELQGDQLVQVQPDGTPLISKELPLQERTVDLGARA